jgi:pimeloyl-ACP methyl ester carboxylesterase
MKVPCGAAACSVTWFWRSQRANKRAFPAVRERFEQRFANHRTVVLETAKHFIQEDEPQRIAAEIRAFLR